MPASSAAPIGHQLNGLIERVTFFSEESGFCVLRVKAERHRDLVTVVGSMPPNTREGMEKYLASGMVKGIRPIYAKRLIARFGEELFEVIEQDAQFAGAD
jgi:exodeoxyribonuclease V alpha subunit